MKSKNECIVLSIVLALSTPHSKRYAVVDKSKKIRKKGKSSQQLHQEPVTDVYDVVDKTKKRRNKGNSSPSHKHHQGISDACAILDNKKQINPKTDSVIDCDIVTVAEIFKTDDATQNDFASVPVYEDVGHFQESAEKRLLLPTLQ